MSVNAIKDNNQIDELIEEIQTIVGLNFEASLVKKTLEENNNEFLPTVAKILGKNFSLNIYLLITL